MKVSSHPETQEFLNQFPLDNDVRQVVRTLDTLTEKKKSVLVIGCLEEPIANVLADLGHSVTGVDLRPYNRGDEYRGPDEPRYRHVVGNFLDVAFTEKFDLIISVSVIEHAGLGYYKDEVDPIADTKIMRKAYSLLADGGKMVITVPIGGAEYQTKHWRLYSLDTFDKRMLDGFRVTKREYWFTSYKGNEKASEKDVRENINTADISILLVLEKNVKA